MKDELLSLQFDELQFTDELQFLVTLQDEGLDKINLFYKNFAYILSDVAFFLGIFRARVYGKSFQ